MAVFGLQIFFSLIVFCFLTKLTKYYSLGRWLLCKGLFRYWPPTNEEFKAAIKQRYAKESNSKSKKQTIPKSYQKSASSASNDESTTGAEEFPIPVDTTIELKMFPLTYHDVIQVKYVDEFCSLVDFTAGTIFVYLLTEFYLWIMPLMRKEQLQELNLSLLWCFVSILLILSALTKFVREYMKAEEGILCIIFGALSFLLAMCLQYVDEHLLQLNLKETYGNRTIRINDDDEDTATAHLDRRFIYIVMMLSLINAYQSMILFFPAFRFGQLQHVFLVKFKKLQDKKKIIVYLLTMVNFALPIFASLLWLKPIVARLTEQELLLARIASILLCLLLRFGLFKTYLQMYLDTAVDRVKLLYEQQQSATSRITNLSYQRNVTSIFFYIGVVASQYILPAFLELLLCFNLKTFTDGSSTNVEQQSRNVPPVWLQHLDVYMNNSNASLVTSWNEMRTSFTSQQISVFLAYFLFWHHTVFCLISCGSLVYNTYMQRDHRDE